MITGGPTPIMPALFHRVDRKSMDMQSPCSNPERVATFEAPCSVSVPLSQVKRLTVSSGVESMSGMRP